MRMDVEGRRRKGRICGGKSDEDGCGGEEKERKNMWGRSDEDGCGGEEKERKYMSGLEFAGGTAAICRRAVPTGRNAL